MDFSEELLFARYLAIEAGDRLLTVARDELSTNFKAGLFDMVTQADLDTEAMVRRRLLERFPHHSVVGEEEGRSVGDQTSVWYVDPIDGTASFRLGYPYWSVSIGMERDGAPFLGVVYSPARGELFLGEAGKGAFLNGERIRVSSYANLSQCLFGTGFGHERGERMRKNMVRLERMMTSALDIRRGGSAAMDLCYVACGRIAFYFEEGLGSHDMAAGNLIVREAGGRVTDYSGAPVSAERPFQVLASNSLVHQQVIDLLRNPEMEKN